MLKQNLKLFACLVPAVFSVGCATQTAVPYDYSAFRESNPHSILVLPPVNNSPDVKATYSVFSQVTIPLAEAGYYVLPVALVDETFKQNGLTSAADIHAVDTKRLRQIFGADAALYLTITKYGTSYLLINSITEVAAYAKLVDLRTGALLWVGTVNVVDDGGSNNSGGGIVGALVAVAVKQILNTALDKAHPVAGIASARLLSGGVNNGLLYGPRSPNYALTAAGTGIAAKPATAPASTVASATQLAQAPSPARTTTAWASPAASPAPVLAQPAMAVMAAATVAAAAPAQSMLTVEPATAAPAPAPAAAPATVLSAPEPASPAAPIEARTIVSAQTSMVLAVAAPAYRAPPAPAPAVPAAPAPSQLYATTLVEMQSQHSALDPSSVYYRSDAYEWVMARKAEFMSSGMPADLALRRAVAGMDHD